MEEEPETVEDSTIDRVADYKEVKCTKLFMVG